MSNPLHYLSHHLSPQFSCYTLSLAQSNATLSLGLSLFFHNFMYGQIGFHSLSLSRQKAVHSATFPLPGHLWPPNVAARTSIKESSVRGICWSHSCASAEGHLRCQHQKVHVTGKAKGKTCRKTPESSLPGSPPMQPAFCILWKVTWGYVSEQGL